MFGVTVGSLILPLLFLCCGCLVSVLLLLLLWVDVHERRCWWLKHACLPSMRLPWRDQTSSLGRRAVAQTQSYINVVCTPLSRLEVKMHTEAHSPEVPTGRTDTLIFSTSLVFGLLICWPASVTCFSSPLCMLLGVTASSAFITPNVNQTHTMVQSFLCYQMVRRSRLVIREVDFVFFLIFLVFSGFWG